MKVGMIGLGKLGAPVAVAIAAKGHQVIGYDLDPTYRTKIYTEAGPDGKEPFRPYLESSPLRFAPLEELVDGSDIIFVAVQTPHEKAYEGDSRLPEDRKDFDYRPLEKCIMDLARLIQTPKVVSIISTVLPGTIRHKILPLTNQHMRVCYNPSFIAMGTVMKDFLNPEFTIIGTQERMAGAYLARFYQSIHPKPVFEMSLESAEITKVAYNTFIGLKICFANTIMELTQKVGGNVDHVVGALTQARDRLVSPKYLEPGMGDGGGCHPRDNIALSWLAREKGLSFDLFECAMRCREKQAEWLVNLMCEHPLPKAILGRAFKAESTLIAGSPAVLCEALLFEKGHKATSYDPLIDPEPPTFDGPHVFLIATKHRVFKDFKFPEGSVVIDPHRYIPNQEGVTVIWVGRNEIP